MARQARVSGERRGRYISAGDGAPMVETRSKRTESVYDPTWDSLRTHPVPEWYEDAKLGIVFHWGLYSVPGWAPRVPDTDAFLLERGPEYLLRHNPRAEWYRNSMRIKGGPTQQHHAHVYGDGYPYDNFVKTFNDASDGADLTALADLCRTAGARYVLLTAKHHDGFALWPSGTAHPVKGPYHSRRDLVGDLTDAVRERRLRMGLYYSGGYDWPYSGVVVSNAADMSLAIPHDKGFVRYVTAHWRELIDRYQPSILWNDIAWPRDPKLPRLLSHYYNVVDEGVVNDRWKEPAIPRNMVTDALTRVAGSITQALWRSLPEERRLRTFGSPKHCDVRTCEHDSGSGASSGKWELVRPLGSSFGVNRNETPEDLISQRELIQLLCDVVAKNGNLLLGVGPRPDGTVPEASCELLEALGSWLDVNGEAVYGSRPWVVAESATTDGTPVRFTKSGEAVYALVMGMPASRRITLRGIDGSRTQRVRLVGARVQLDWFCDAGGDLSVTLPEQIPLSAVTVLDLGTEVRARLRRLP